MYCREDRFRKNNKAFIMSYMPVATDETKSNIGVPVIEHEGHRYPAFQAQGNAAQFIMPVARQVLKGHGYDIGFSRPEWKLEGAVGIDLTDKQNPFHADLLPDGHVDYIFSSHCLEHVPNYADTLDYWMDHLKPLGVMLLYLPDFSQTYWRPWNNRKHVHAFTPDLLSAYFKHRDDVKECFVSGVDLNNSFSVLVSKQPFTFSS